MDSTKYSIVKRYIPIRHNTRPGTLLTGGTPRFFVAHDTGDSGATAENEWRYFSNLVDRSASAHTFIDDKQIIELIPTGLFDPAERAWHVIYDVPTDNQLFGDDANDVAIGVELCWGGGINFMEAYDRYVWYLAMLCTKFSKDPRKFVVSHQTLDPQRKIDPSNALNRYGVTYSQLIADIVKEMNATAVTDDVKVVVNDRLAAMGFIDGGTTYVPVRAIGEALGMTVGWDGATKQATVNQKTIRTQLVHSTAYAAIRDAADLLGATISWDPSTRKVYIYKRG